jgi:hypothetical protein
MLSLLELLPTDILEHIAFLTAPTNFSPPESLLHLMLTSSTMYHNLSLPSAPHLYAKIFRACFDLGATWRLSLSKMTDSRLAQELVSRFRLLHRVRRHDLSSRETLKADLCTAMRMLLESDGLNEEYLDSIGFLQFVIGHLERCVEDNLHRRCGDIPADDSNQLAIESLAWILTRGVSSA